MIIYLYGLDSYRRQQKLLSLTAVYRAQHPEAPAALFDFKENNAGDGLKEFLRQDSMFYSFQLGILKNISAAETDLSALIKEQLDGKAITLMISDSEKLSGPYKFLFREPVISQSFDYLKGKNLLSFLQKEAGVRNLSLPSLFLRELATTCGNDTWALISELDKISSAAGVFSMSNDGKKVLGAADFFRNINVLQSQRALPARLTALENLFCHNEEPAKIFNILAAGRYGKERFADYDVLIKSGKLDYEEVLLDYILR